MKHKSITSSAELKALLKNDDDWVSFVHGINLHCEKFTLKSEKWRVIRRDSDSIDEHRYHFACYDGIVYGFAVDGVNYFIFRIN